jgi:hypothetical protein
MMVNLMRQLKLNLEFVEIVYYLIFSNRSNYQGRMCHLDEDWFECNLLRDCIIHEVV